MVRNAFLQDHSLSPDRSGHFSTTVRLNEVIENGLRFEASTYDAAAREAVAAVRRHKGGAIRLFGKNGLSGYADNAFRFKRNFVSKEMGTPFLTSSNIIDIDQNPAGYLSRKSTKNFDDLKVERYDVLISCSGTIGNIGFVGRRQHGWLCSQDAIKVRFEEPNMAGFAAAFLRTKFGRLQITRSTYGSVIRHIEPDHLETVFLPKFESGLANEIGSKFLEALAARDEALDYLCKSRLALLSVLGLPARKSDPRKFQSESIRLSGLRNRFEASFHSPNALSLEKSISDCRTKFLPIGSDLFATNVHAVTKFRKRVYVKGEGIPLYSSKSIFQIDPIEVKRLGRGVHAKDLDEIGLKPGMVLVTCSGTIGNVLSVCDYMDGWSVNQHAIRLYSAKPEINSLLYVWLSSETGNLLVKRNSYGSVILEIDRWMVSNILAPHPDQVPTAEIHSLVSKANQLRTKAWNLEQEAIAEIERRIQTNS